MRFEQWEGPVCFSHINVYFNTCKKFHVHKRKIMAECGGRQHGLEKDGEQGGHIGE